MSENVITSSNIFGPPRPAAPNAVQDESANEDAATNTSGGAGAPVDPTPVVTSTPATPVVKPGVAPDPNWAHCSDTSKPAWPGKKA